MIRGEYWITDGSVDEADGEAGDYNHEGRALEHVFGAWADAVKYVAQDYDIETDFGYMGMINCDAVSNTISSILEILMSQGHSEESANGFLMQELGINQPAYLVICGFGDAQEYVMMYEGWISVRGDNADVYGFDAEKRKSLADGIEEILFDEGHLDDEGIAEFEIAVSDFKTGKSFSLSLEQLREPVAPVRTNQPINTKGDRRFNWTTPDTEENKYSKKIGSKPNPWNTAAQQQGVIGPGQQLWRGTSESRGFKAWLSMNG